VALIELVLRGLQRDVEGDLGQFGHGRGDVRHGGALLDVQRRQPLQHQLPCHAQRGAQLPSAGAQGVDQGADVGQAGEPRVRGGKVADLGLVAATNALNVTAVGRGGRRCDCVKGEFEHGTRGAAGGLC